jgi:hypothetical protein
LKRLGILLIFILLCSSCGPIADCGDSASDNSCKRILFIGNSYIYANNLPEMFSDLARSGGHKVETSMAASGGWTLADHVRSPETIKTITSSNWDYVILQEQSQIPSLLQSRINSMYPAARTLVQQIEISGATPIFFLTWAHQKGWLENGFPDYRSMQYQIDIGYMAIAQELNVPLAPVGYAWLLVNGQEPQINLWQEDGSHPTEFGTYLAACVFYATLFQESPEGLAFTSTLPTVSAQILQHQAAEAVLINPRQCNLRFEGTFRII